MTKKLATKTEFAQRAGIAASTLTKLMKGRLAPAMVGPRLDLDHEAVRKYLQDRAQPKAPDPVPGIDALFEDALQECKKSGRWTASHIMRSLQIGYARAQRILGQLGAAGHCDAEPPPIPPTAQAPAPKPPPEVGPKATGAGRQPRNSANPFTDEGQLAEVPQDIEGIAHLTIQEAVDQFGTTTRLIDWLKALKEIEALNEKRIKNAQSRGRLISRALVETGVIDAFNSAHMRLLTDGAKAITAAVVAKHEAGVSEQEIEAYVTDVVGSFIRPVKAKVDRNLASVPTD